MDTSNRKQGKRGDGLVGVDGELRGLLLIRKIELSKRIRLVKYVYLSLLYTRKTCPEKMNHTKVPSRNNIIHT